MRSAPDKMVMLVTIDTINATIRILEHAKETLQIAYRMDGVTITDSTSSPSNPSDRAEAEEHDPESDLGSLQSDAPAEGRSEQSGEDESLAAGDVPEAGCVPDPDPKDQSPLRGERLLWKATPKE